MMVECLALTMVDLEAVWKDGWKVEWRVLNFVEQMVEK